MAGCIPCFVFLALTSPLTASLGQVRYAIWLRPSNWWDQRIDRLLVRRHQAEIRSFSSPLLHRPCGLLFRESHANRQQHR